MKKAVKILILFLFLFQMGYAQNVIVTVQVFPPYSTYLPDYLNNPSRVYVTLLSNEDATIKLKASVTGDNGISVVSSNSSSVPSLQLLANQIKMLNGTDLKNYLNILVKKERHFRQLMTTISQDLLLRFYLLM